MFQEDFWVKQESNWLLEVWISKLPKTLGCTVGAGERGGVESPRHSQVPAVPIRGFWRAALCSGLGWGLQTECLKGCEPCRNHSRLDVSRPVPPGIRSEKSGPVCPAKAVLTVWRILVIKSFFHALNAARGHFLPEEQPKHCTWGWLPPLCKAFYNLEKRL